jgi:hypothetical protein
MTADCASTPSTLPLCSVDFSNNASSTTVTTESGAPVIQLQDLAAPLAATASLNDGVKGNKGELGLNLLQGVPLQGVAPTPFPGISFAMKLNTADTTALADVYLNYTLSPNCDGDPTMWVDLVTTASDMLAASPQAPDVNGYTTYSATPADVVWTHSGSHPYYAPDGTTIVLNQAINGGGGPMSLAALMAAYPQACIWNYPNPTAGGITPTPGVVIVLGDSHTTTAKTVWLKDIMIGTKQVF